MGGIVAKSDYPIKKQYNIYINGGDLFEGTLGPFPFMSDNLYNLPELKTAIIRHLYTLDYLKLYLTNNTNTKLNPDFLDLEYFDKSEWNYIDTYNDFNRFSKLKSQTLKLKLNLKKVLQKHYNTNTNKMESVLLLSNELCLNKKIIQKLLY